ncbi:MAG: type II toxin-antitoxin system YafQ family toxin [Erysipelotrichaceae bacterium]|nr:type II toxin-antitoxin system YafQ family toxin [Erysipelotrichaceae bacterium]
MRKTKRTVKVTTAFRKDYKLAIKRGMKMELLDAIIETLSMGDVLLPEYRDHELSGKWKGHRECHIQPDWLLIYRIDDTVLVLTLTRTGKHSDLFVM